ncbi:MAG: AgmX/PglI C-terminal domain-containing protein [Myxococcota bacterium]
MSSAPRAGGSQTKGAGQISSAARSDGPRILRAAVVQSGKVIEEKRLRQRGSLTIGRDAKCTFVIADPELPKKHELFAVRGSGYELIFTESMRGKISTDGTSKPVDFASLKAQGLVKQKGGVYTLALTDKHRGKVIIGDTTIIFQFVVAPPAPVQPKLPANARGTIWQSIDWPYAAALAFAFVIETPMVVWFQYAPIPAEMTLDELDDRWAKLIVPEFKPEKKIEVPDEKAAGPSENKVEKKEEKKEAADDPEVAAKKARRRTEIRSNIASKGILAVLGTVGEGGASGAVADVFSEGGGFGDLDSAFDGIAGVGVATEGGGRTTRGGGSGEAASIGGLATASGGQVGHGGTKSERRVGSVTAATPEVDGDLDSSAIARVVRSRMRMVQNCYEKELKRNPTLSGKIEIEFTIGEDGRIEDALVARNGMGSDAVGSCIVGRIRQWRFPKPKGGSVTVAYPFIFTSSS